MNRSVLTLLSSILVLTGLVWLLPIFHVRWLQWLSLYWQWGITCLIALSAICWLLIRRYKKRRTSRHLADEFMIHEDHQQARRQLIYNWDALWKAINKRHLSSPYTLPFLMMLGADGSGKTSWLTEAGFERLSATEHQKSGIVFWLGEQAVIIELAGHYYTREKEQISEDLWRQLISLLKKKRPRRPLTGIIATVSIDQLVLRQPSGLLELARQMRWRLLELNRQFQTELPAWLLLTQADRLNGFSELFRRRSNQRQVQPWGFFLQEGYRRELFLEAFRNCQQELADSLLDCIHHEKDAGARQAQVRYIIQFSLLGERLRFFCEEIFLYRDGAPSPMLKGIWFTSCGQIGNSINMLASELARQHSFKVVLEQPQLRDSQSYFNQQFFNQVLFHDLGTVGINPVAHRLWLLKNSLIVGSLIFLLFSGLDFLWSRIEYNSYLLDEQKKITHEYRQAIKRAGDNPAMADVILPLYRLRNLDHLYQQSVSWNYHGVMDWITARTIHSIYQQQLQQVLVQPVVHELQLRLNRSKASNSKRLFDDLHYYLMLFNKDIRVPQLLEDHIFSIIMQQSDLSKHEEQSLHLLMEDALQLSSLSIQPDRELINQSSFVLTGQIDELLIYDQIRALPEYRGTVLITDIFGNDFYNLFSVKGINELPRFYTLNAYRSLDLSETSPLIKEQLAKLNRIEKGVSDVSAIDMARISRRIREIYFHNYIQTWVNLAKSIQLRSTANIQEILQQITRLSYGNGAVLTSVFNTVISETSLSKEENSASRISADDPAIVNKAFADYDGYSTHYQTLLIPILDRLVSELQVVTTHSSESQALYNLAAEIMRNEESALNDLWQLASTSNMPGQQSLKTLFEDIWAQIRDGAGQFCQKQWQQNVYSFWRQNLYKRFPFSLDTPDDVRLADFSEMFKPGGLLDRFTKSTLAPFLQKNQDGWHVRNINGRQLPIIKTFLRQLTLSRHLQEQMFNPNGVLRLRYQMRCNSLTTDATVLNIRDNNGRFVYSHGPRIWQDREWPGQETEQLTLTLKNETSRLFQKDYNGIWSWFRFVFDCQQRLNGNRVDLSCQHKGYITKFEIALQQSRNPFQSELFSRVNLPQKILK